MTYIDWIIRHNVHDFRFVQFIGSDKIPFALGKEAAEKQQQENDKKECRKRKKFFMSGGMSWRLILYKRKRGEIRIVSPLLFFFCVLEMLF